MLGILSHRLSLTSVTLRQARTTLAKNYYPPRLPSCNANITPQKFTSPHHWHRANNVGLPFLNSYTVSFSAGQVGKFGISDARLSLALSQLEKVKTKAKKEREQRKKKKNESTQTILKRWNVPWSWEEFTVTSSAFLLSAYVLWVLEHIGLPTLSGLSPDAMAGLYLTLEIIQTTMGLGVLYYFTKPYRPLSSDLLCCDFKKPFNRQRGWLLWAGITFSALLIAMVLAVIAIVYLGVELPKNKKDGLDNLLPLIGASTFSTACVLAIVGILAPLLEETIFRGYMMASLTKWVPTPVAVLLSSAVFALAHLNLKNFPQLFLGGIAFGFSYAHTRNLLTPMVVHSLCNSGAVLFLLFLKCKGIDVEQLRKGISKESKDG